MIRRRYTLFNAVIALVITVLLACAFAGKTRAQEAPSPADASAIQTVIEAQINAFRKGDDAAAYSHAAPNIKQIFPTIDQFISMVKTGYMPLYNPESFVFGRNAVIGSQIHQEVIVTDEKGKQWQAVYTLRQQEDGSWKITSVKMNPYAGAST
ncbi:MAG: DUF4864 domain-containing protein [Nitratireductor sp.]